LDKVEFQPIRDQLKEILEDIKREREAREIAEEKMKEAVATASSATLALETLESELQHTSEELTQKLKESERKRHVLEDEVASCKKLLQVKDGSLEEQRLDLRRLQKNLELRESAQKDSDTKHQATLNELLLMREKLSQADAAEEGIREEMSHLTAALHAAEKKASIALLEHEKELSALKRQVQAAASEIADTEDSHQRKLRQLEEKGQREKKTDNLVIEDLKKDLTGAKEKLDTCQQLRRKESQQAEKDLSGLKKEIASLQDLVQQMQTRKEPTKMTDTPLRTKTVSVATPAHVNHDNDSNSYSSSNSNSNNREQFHESGRLTAAHRDIVSEAPPPQPTPSDSPKLNATPAAKPRYGRNKRSVTMAPPPDAAAPPQDDLTEVATPAPPTVSEPRQVASSSLCSSQDSWEVAGTPPLRPRGMGMRMNSLERHLDPNLMFRGKESGHADGNGQADVNDNDNDNGNSHRQGRHSAGGSLAESITAANVASSEPKGRPRGRPLSALASMQL
jgi:hypothetical protein